MVMSSKRVAGAALERQQKIIFLEYLRCFAFISVLLGHKFPGGARIQTAVPNAFTDAYNFFMPMFWNGGTGVIVFFLVSGYVITAAAETDNPVSFLVRRAFRIYPLYIAAVLMQFYFMDGRIPPWEALWPRLSLLGDFTHTDRVLNGVDWTLRIEILFYAAMTLLCFFPVRTRMIVLAISVIPAILLCALLPGFPNWSALTYDFFNQSAPFLLLGSIVYLYETKRVPLYFLASVIGLTYANLSYRLSLLEIYNIWGSVAAGCLFCLAWIFREKLPQSKLIVWTAGLTYSVYLFHTWGFDYFYTRIGASEPVRSVATLVLLFASCWLLSVIIEKPFTQIGRQLSRGSKNLFGALRTKQRIGDTN